LEIALEIEINWFFAVFSGIEFGPGPPQFWAVDLEAKSFAADAYVSPSL
jgi:hypothetical protein